MTWKQIQLPKAPTSEKNHLRYFISEEGEIVKILYDGRKKKMGIRLTSEGYCYTEIQKIKYHVHRLVLETFVGPRPPGMECCHWDGNKQNNRLSNLRWDTQENNELDKIRHGTNSSQLRPNSKLTEEKVRIIRQRLVRGERNKDLAIEYGVTAPCIHAIKKRKTWKHI